MASLFLHEQLPTTSEAALREFDERYLLALSAGADPGDWGAEFEEKIGAPRVTFPLSFATAKFRETKAAAGTYEDMEEGSFDVTVVEYDAGHEAPLYELLNNVFRYRRWTQAPAMIAAAERWFVQEQLAAILEANPVCPWDGLALFHDSHQANPKKPGLATFDNLNAAALDPASVANLTAQMSSMKTEVKDMNGKLMRVTPTEIWLPPAKVMPVAHLLAQNHLASGETNPLFGALKIVEIPQLTDANDWYLVDRNLISQGLAPLIGVSHRPSDTLALREFGEESDYFKNSGRVKKGVHIWKGFGPVFPHAIRKVAGA